jgi:hypothetical protein
MFRNTLAMRRYSSNFRLGGTYVYPIDPFNGNGRCYVNRYSFFSVQRKVYLCAMLPVLHLCQLIPRNSVLLRKLLVVQLVKKLSAFY